MREQFQPDKIVITEFFMASSVKEINALIEAVHPSDIYESTKLVQRPILAYKDTHGGRIQYTRLSGAMPFNSYAEAEAARLQFIHDHCEPKNDDFEL